MGGRGGGTSRENLVGGIDRDVRKPRDIPMDVEHLDREHMETIGVTRGIEPEIESHVDWRMGEDGGHIRS